jgi:hypothetical protein
VEFVVNKTVVLVFPAVLQCNPLSYSFNPDTDDVLCTLHTNRSTRGGAELEALHYMPEGGGLDPRLGYWNFLLT